MENVEDFITNRYQDQLDWLNRKAIYYKRLYSWGHGVIIVFSAIIPVLIQMANAECVWPKISASVMSVGVAIIGGLLSRFAPYKLWQQYRITAETLIAEYWSYKASLGKYNEVDDSDALFAERVQSILKAEHEDWIKLHTELEMSLLNKKEYKNG